MASWNWESADFKKLDKIVLNRKSTCDELVFFCCYGFLFLPKEMANWVLRDSAYFRFILVPTAAFFKLVFQQGFVWSCTPALLIMND